jgi:Flp pilus assembly protein TadG
MKSTKSNSNGQSTTEFALVLPILLMLLFGIIQFSLVLYTYGFVAYSARTASRYASIHSSQNAHPATSASIQTYVNGLADAVDTSKLTVTSTWAPNNNPGSAVTIKVSYPFTPFTPYVSSATITVSSTMQATILY